MSDKKVTIELGGGFLGILTLILITLKLTGHIDWSWLWVLAPIWFPIVGFLGFMGVMVVVAFISILLYVWLQR